MKRSVREVVGVLLVVAVSAVWMLSCASDISAQQATESMEKQVQGTWTLISIYNEQDGKRLEQFGPNPRGIEIFTSEGRFSHIIMPATLPKFVSGNRMKFTDEECRAVAQGVIAYFGKYTVNEKDKDVTLSIESSSFPNWDGAVQKRNVSFAGDVMTLVNPTPALGGGINYSIWKRVK